MTLCLLVYKANLNLNMKMAQYIQIKVNGFEDLKYDPTTGMMLNQDDQPIGAKNPNGFTIKRKVNDKRTFVRAHRLIYETVYGEIPLNKRVLHKDNNKYNNKLDNLYLGYFN